MVPSDHPWPFEMATDHRRIDTYRGHLAAVTAIIWHAVRSTDPVVDTACTHLVRAGGKGFRPLVSVLSAAAVGEVTHRTHVAAASCELLHLSTLYHDDVIDGADLRRGTSSANRAWGERLAVLAGNRLTASALEVASRAGADVPPIVASTYRQLVEGERRESLLVGCTEYDIADYLRVIDGKTASLIAAAARVGAISADAPGTQVDAVTAWGRTVGQAYQVADDLLDLTASSAETGKPAGNDLRQGVFTLPLLDAMSGRDGKELRRLLARARPYPQASVERVLTLIRRCGAIERASRRVDELLAGADEALAALPPGPARSALQGLARSVIPTVANTSPTPHASAADTPRSAVTTSTTDAPLAVGARFPASEPEPV